MMQLTGQVSLLLRVEAGESAVNAQQLVQKSIKPVRTEIQSFLFCDSKKVFKLHTGSAVAWNVQSLLVSDRVV
jgi:hypothetical protein